MPITIVDIARRAGVSHPLVSKVLNGGVGTASASKETSRKILKIAEELGYRPHVASQALRGNQFRSIGVLMGASSEFFLPQTTLSSLTRSLAQNDYSCVLVCIDKFDFEHIKASSLLKSHMVDALLIGYVYEPPSSLVEGIEAMGVNPIWLNRAVDFDSVYVDEADATMQLVSHLCELGHKQIAYIDFSGEGRSNTLVAKRLDGFDRITRKLGIKAHYLTDMAIPIGQRLEASKRLLSTDGIPRALIVHSTEQTQVIIQAAMQLGLGIPRDISITTFGNIEQHLEIEPQITCVLHPSSQMGQEAGCMILGKIREPKKKNKSKCLKYSFVEGGSTAHN